METVNDNDSNNYSLKYSSTTEKTVEQEKQKENNIVVREVEEKQKGSDVVIKESLKEKDDEFKENLVVEEREDKLDEDVVVKDLEVDLQQDNLPATEEASKIPEQNENLELAAAIIQSGFRGHMVMCFFSLQLIVLFCVPVAKIKCLLQNYGNTSLLVTTKPIIDSFVEHLKLTLN